MKQTIPWLRIGAEGVAIVVSILLAFAIDAWWAGSQTRKEELRTVIGLQNQFRGHKELLQAVIARQLTRIATSSELLNMMRTASWSGRAEGIDRKLGLLLIPGTTDFGSGELESLLTSGKIDLVTDPYVRRQLIEWQSVSDELSDDEVIIRAHITQEIFPYLAGRGVPMAGIMVLLSGFSLTAEAEPDARISRERTLEGNTVELDRLFSDPTFLSFMEQLHGYRLHSLAEYERTMTTIDDMLAHLDEYRQQ